MFSKILATSAIKHSLVDGAKDKTLVHVENVPSQLLPYGGQVDRAFKLEFGSCETTGEVVDGDVYIEASSVDSLKKNIESANGDYYCNVSLLKKSTSDRIHTAGSRTKARMFTC